ncbi:MAG: hypothetical protein ACE5JP_04235 [Candidatus Bipolaricaulia bacterium]
MKQWEDHVYMEYIQADNEFVGNHLPYKSIDHSSFGLIADATGFGVFLVEGEARIKPLVGGLDEMLKSMRNIPGTSSDINKQDARECMNQFVGLWEAKIREAGKWEEMIKRVEAEGPIEEWQEPEEGPGFLRRLLGRS